MVTWPCQWGYVCGRGGGDNGTGGYWVQNLCPHWGILYRNGVEDPSTEAFERGCVVSQGDGGVLVPYKAYIEANLTILELPWYYEDALFLFISDHKYGERVPVQMGNELGKSEATTGKRKYESQKELLDKIDLAGLEKWSQNKQKVAWELITE